MLRLKHKHRRGDQGENGLRTAPMLDFRFVVLGEYGGLVPATFASVFISALGDRTSTVKTTVFLSTILTVFCVIVFHYGLSLQLPLFHWG